MKICKTILFFAVLAFVCGVFGSNRDLGQTLPFKVNPENKAPAFGAVYTYGEDPDGSNYIFTYASDVDSSVANTLYRWNFYLRSTDSFLLDWSAGRTTDLAVIQVQVGTGGPVDSGIVNKLLVGQKNIAGTGELYFVLADNSNRPVFNVSISDLCTKYPKNFSDLTRNSACGQINP